MLIIDFTASEKHDYKISLLNMSNQRLWKTTFNSGNTNLLQIPRPKSISKGVYTLRCIDLKTNEEFSQKVIFL